MVFLKENDMCFSDCSVAVAFTIKNNVIYICLYLLFIYVYFDLISTETAYGQILPKLYDLGFFFQVHPPELVFGVPNGSKCAFANLSMAFWRNKVMGPPSWWKPIGGPRDRHRLRKFEQRFFGWNMPIRTSFFFQHLPKIEIPKIYCKKALNIRNHPWTPTKTHGDKKVVF